MRTLTPTQRRALRARAHALHPVVAVGQHGLTPAVLHEIDVALLAHGLIKVRVHDEDRAAREALLERVCAELDAAPVQHIGKLLVLWRPKPAPEPEPKGPAARKPVRRDSSAKPAPSVRATPGPGARRERSHARAPVACTVPPRRRRAAVPVGPAAPRGVRPRRRRGTV